VDALRDPESARGGRLGQLPCRDLPLEDSESVGVSHRSKILIAFLNP
jgi:hypothetical protein